jgi:hypothetical protein
MVTRTKKKPYVLQLFPETHGTRWWWRLVSSWNGKKVAGSLEGFAKRSNALAAFRLLRIPEELWDMEE